MSTPSHAGWDTECISLIVAEVDRIRQRALKQASHEV